MSREREKEREREDVRKSNETFQRINWERRYTARAFSTDPVDCVSRHGEILVRRVHQASKVFVVESRSSRGRYVLCSRGTKRQSNRWRPFEIWFATAVHIRPRIVAFELLHFMSAVVLNIRRTRVHPARQFRVGNGSKVDSNLLGMFFLPSPLI